MRRVFVDTNYWAALFVPGDHWREVARAVSASLGPVQFVTTEEVLTEFLNLAASAGAHARRLGAQAARTIARNPDVEVVPQSHATFEDGLTLYERRSDKGYSLTDCISMTAMRRLRLQEVLTHDRHFVQEGFVALLRE
jgi:predicted nucleic acid-binding protein